jgi:uncharacterized repeat protein (TIGR01451 family)
MLHHSALFKKGLLIPILLFFFLIFAPRFHISSVKAVGVETGCAITPDKLDGQGLRVTGLGLRVTGLGLRVTGLGLSVTGLGLRVTGLGTTPEQIVQDIVNNPVTPAWLTSLFPDVGGGTGYNGTPTIVLVVDDFSTPDAHGFEVRRVFDDLFAALDATDDGILNSSPNLLLENINIGDPSIGFQTVGIASSIRERVNALNSLGYQHFVINMSFGIIPCDSTENVTLVDESGSTFRLTKDFSYDLFESYRDQVLSPGFANKAMKPILECVKKNSPTSYTAYFGYENKNVISVTLPIGWQNYFLPEPKDKGQPDTFGPGRQKFVFKVDFNGSPLSWIINSPDNRTYTATASSNPSLSCASRGITPPAQLGSVIPEGFGFAQYAAQNLGIPQAFLDEYMEHLVTSVEEDPVAGLQPLLRSLLQRSYADDTDGNPETIFAVIPVASSGNFRHLFGPSPLVPASFPESIAAAATLGDFGDRWVLSHDGNLIAPGAGYPFAFDAAGNIAEMGAGTSFSAPFVSMLSSLWLTYPDACTFGNGLPPLTTASTPKNANAISRLGLPSALNCAKPVVEYADLALTKTTEYESVSVGGEISYDITVTNNGPFVANNVVVIDTLPEGTTFQSVWTSQGTCEYTTCNLGHVAPGQEVTITLVVTAPTEAGSIVNSASVVSTTVDPDDNNNTDSVTTTVEAVELQPIIPIRECVTYFGGGAYRVYFGYDNPNSVSVTIPIGELNFISPDPMDRGQGTTFLPGRQFDTFFADYDGSIISWKLDDNIAYATNDPVEFCADAGVTKTGPAEVTVGQTFRYDISVYNPSWTDVEDVTLTDALPAGLSVVSIPETCYLGEGNVITCDVGLLPGGSTVLLAFDVITTQPGQITNTAVVTSLEGSKGNPNNNSSSITTTISEAPVIEEPVADTDADGFNDTVDNCPSVPNDDQTNADGDTAGNACDSDDDNDTVADEVDNCAIVPNLDQADVNENGIGDACDTSEGEGSA